MSFFSNLFDETQMSAPPEGTRHHNSIKLLIPQPLRADLLLSVHSETPCTNIFSLNKHFYLLFATMMLQNEKKTRSVLIK